MGCIDDSLIERRKHLMACFDHDLGQDDIFAFAQHEKLDSVNEQRLNESLSEAVHGGAKGLMLKDLFVPYRPDSRSNDWLKLKKDYIDSGFCDSFDAVVVGIKYGRGKREKTIGAVLLAVRAEEIAKSKVERAQDDKLRLQTFCWVGTG